MKPRNGVSANEMLWCVNVWHFGLALALGIQIYRGEGWPLPFSTLQHFAKYGGELPWTIVFGVCAVIGTIGMLLPRRNLVTGIMLIPQQLVLMYGFFGTFGSILGLSVEGIDFGRALVGLVYIFPITFLHTWSLWKVFGR